MSTTHPRGPVDSSRTPRYCGAAACARFGGNAIREVSRLLRAYNPAQSASPFALAQVADAGDIAANPSDIGGAVETIQSAARPAGHRGPPDAPRRRPHRRTAAAARRRQEARPHRTAPLRCPSRTDDENLGFGIVT
ncbi:hypothetical protein GCM10010246_05480 [Streptomyces cuspidosporus]|uniref:Uncharacterized protein n=1 Tax=Streptomyces cuspidosporus TaxID=66882 RepID=A0ABP5SBX2_9ACTN